MNFMLKPIRSFWGFSHSRPLGKGIYLLPNLLTTASLFAGFYSIVATIHLQFTAAAVAILIALITDGLDGRIARLTHTTSAFGAEYDSLADLVSFGIAPALAMYSWGLRGLGKIGWLIAFCYAAAVALRLARFNVQVHDKRYFRGLPCPLPAGLLASWILTQSLYSLSSSLWIGVDVVLTLGLGILQVSAIPYRSFKDIHFKNRAPFWVVLMSLALFVGVAIEPAPVLFGVFLGYVLIGLGDAIRVKWVRRLRRIKKA